MMQVEKIKEAFLKFMVRQVDFTEMQFARQMNEIYEKANQSMTMNQAVGFYAGYLAALASLDEKATDSGEADMIDFLCGDKDYFILRGKKITRDMLNTMRFSSTTHAQKCAECGKDKRSWADVRCMPINALPPDPLKEKQGE